MQSVDKLKSALERATAAGDQAAIDDLTQRISEAQGAQTPPGYTPGSLDMEPIQSQGALTNATAKPALGPQTPDSILAQRGQAALEQADELGSKGSAWDRFWQWNEAVKGRTQAGALNLVSNRIDAVKMAESQVAAMQEFIFTKLPDAEKQRVREELSSQLEKPPEYFTDSVIRDSISPYRLRFILNQNDDNEAVLESMRAGEPGFIERAKRFGTKFSRIAGQIVAPDWQDDFIAESNLFNAKDADGNIINYDTASGRAYDLWDEESRKLSADFGDIFYEYAVKPWDKFSAEGDASKSIRKKAEKIKEDTVGQYKNRAERPFLKRGSEWGDLLKWETYTDESTASPFVDPAAATIKVAEMVPQIATSVGMSWLFGRGAGKLMPKPGGFATLAEFEKARRRFTTTSGVLGGAVANSMVYDGAVNEVTQTLNEIPDIQLAQHPQIQSLMEAGLSYESAKRMVINDAATAAGKNAWAVSSLITAPTAGLAGRGGAGNLTQGEGGRRAALAAVLSPFEEGFQEVAEGEMTDIEIARIDPDNPVVTDPGRRAERFFGGFLIGVPGAAIEAAGALGSDTPVGVDDDTASAIRDVKEFLDARNERFSYEGKVTDPGHMSRTPALERSAEMEKLESMQEKEANAIKKMVGPVRKHMEDNPVKGRRAEMEMLNALERWANSIMTDIAVARSKRTTAKELQMEESAQVEEMNALVAQVDAQELTLKDITAYQRSLNAVQEQEPITNKELGELEDQGWVTIGDESGAIAITPKGRRAVRNLGDMRRRIEGNDVQYEGDERRSAENLAERERIDMMTDEQKETTLYRDPATGLQNRRALQERGQNEPAYASVNIDSMTWIKENMDENAGTRAAMQVASDIQDAINEGGDRTDMQLYRMGDEEFILTGPSAEAVEQVLQTAATRMTQQRVSTRTQQITPTITWGKGSTARKARRDADAMANQRIDSGQRAARGDAPSSLQAGRFNLSADADIRNWGSIKDQVEAGDTVEVINAEGEVSEGTVVSVSGKSDRPRMQVSVNGAVVTFNPDKGHIVTDETTTPADIKAVTGVDVEGPLPKTIDVANLGRMMRDGSTYANLGRSEMEEAETLAFVMGDAIDAMIEPAQVPSEVTQRIAENARETFIKQFNRSPVINLIHDFKEWASQDFDQFMEFIDAMRANNVASVAGVKGWFNPMTPEKGIYLFTDALQSYAKQENISVEMAMNETLFHEIVGHYGIRGVVPNEAEFNQLMEDLVDAFNVGKDNYAKRLEAYLGLYGATTKNPDKARKRLLGEEMFAYAAGRLLSGDTTGISKKQQGVLQRLVAWLKNFLNKVFRRNVKAHETSDGKYMREFWNDERVQELAVRSQNFLRTGTGQDIVAKREGRGHFMRDGDLFQFGVQQVFRTAMKNLSKAQRKQLAGKYGGMENVPKEVPVFPPEGTMANYEAAAIEVSRANNPYGIKPIELELLGLSEKSHWNLFKDATYLDIKRLYAESKGIKDAELPRDWYKEALPPFIARELDTIFAAIDKMSMVGPIGLMAEDMTKFTIDTEKRGYLANSEKRAVSNEYVLGPMMQRIEEIMSQSVNLKKTPFTYDMFDAHLRSDRAYRVYAEGAKGYKEIDYGTAAVMLFGTDARSTEFMPTPEQDQLIKDYQLQTRQLGYDIAFNEATGEWLDDPRMYESMYSGMFPVGGITDEDYRVHLIKTKGGGHPDMPSGDQHFAANFMHIRTSVAKFHIAPEGINYPNPKYEGMALHLGELQSDWQSGWRGGFSSPFEKEYLNRLGNGYRDLLKSSTTKGMRALQNEMRNKMDDDMQIVYEMMKPLIEAGKTGKIEGLESRPQLLQELSDLSVQEAGMPFDQITSEDRRRDIVVKLISEKVIFPLRSKYEKAKNAGREVINELGEAENEWLYQADARAFTQLDQMSVRGAIQLLQNDIADFTMQLEDYTYRLSQHMSEGTSLPAFIGKMRGPEGYRWINAATFNEGTVERLLRLPYLQNPETLMGPLRRVMEPMGLSENEVVNAAHSIFKEGMAARYEMPSEVFNRLWHISNMETANNAAAAQHTGSQAEFAAEKIFSEVMEVLTNSTELTNEVERSTLKDFPLAFGFQENASAKEATVVMTVYGDEPSQKIFEKYREKLPQIIKDIVAPRISEKMLGGSSGIEEALSDAFRRVIKDMTYNYAEYQLTEYYESRASMEAIRADDYDADADQLDAMGLTHRDNFEPDYLESFITDLEDNFLNNLALDTDSDEYIERVVTDEDGDIISTDEADEWLIEARDQALDEYRESEAYMEEIDQYRDDAFESEHGSDHAYFGSIPTGWDSDGEPTDYIPYEFVHKTRDGHYDINLDGDYITYEYDLRNAMLALASRVRSYYQDLGVIPPEGGFLEVGESDMNTLNAMRKQSEGDVSDADRYPEGFENFGDQVVLKNRQPFDLAKTFSAMVTIDKKFGMQTSRSRGEGRESYWYPASPLHSDQRWRPLGLKYLLAEAIRRGLGAIVWQDGLATATRGGGGVGTSDRVSVEQVRWSKQTVEVDGKAKEFYVIESDNTHPMVVEKNSSMIPMVGPHVAGVISMQEAGNWRPETKGKGEASVFTLPRTIEEIENADFEIVGTEAEGAPGEEIVVFTVYDQLHEKSIGTYASRQEAQDYIQSLRDDSYYMRRRADTKKRMIARTERVGTSLGEKDAIPEDQQAIEGEIVPEIVTEFGKTVASGIVNAQDIGSDQIFLIPGSRTGGYQHTFTHTPILAGARMNYDQMTLRAWNDELKKYGSKIIESYIDVSRDPSTAYGSEGQVGLIEGDADAAFKARYGNMNIIPLPGQNGGRSYTLHSEHDGIIDTYHGYDAALESLDNMKRSYSKPKIVGSKVYTIVINDKMIEEIEGKPQMPFNRDPNLEEARKRAAMKVMERGKNLTDKMQEIKASLKRSWIQQIYDSIRPLKIALQEAGKSDRAYMLNRLAATGQESRMKAALYYGAPVWDEDTMSVDGMGLMDIFSQLDGPVEEWGMYALGMRAREFMFESWYDANPTVKSRILAGMDAAKIPGKDERERIWNYAKHNASPAVGEQILHDLTKEQKDRLGPAGVEWYRRNLWHFREDDPASKEKIRKEYGLPDGQIVPPDLRSKARTGPVFNLRTRNKESAARKLYKAKMDLTDNPEFKTPAGIELMNGDPVRKFDGTPNTHPMYGVKTEEEAERIFWAAHDIANERQKELKSYTDSRRLFVKNVQNASRENTFTVDQMVAMIEIGESNPSFDRVSKMYQEYNSKVLDFVEQAGGIDPESRKTYEHMFYLPMFRIRDDKFGGMFGTKVGVSDLSKPIRRLRGAASGDELAALVNSVEFEEDYKQLYSPKLIKKAVDEGYIVPVEFTNKQGAVMTRHKVSDEGIKYAAEKGFNVGDPLTNIVINLNNMIDFAIKNHAALAAVDDLFDTGHVKKTPMKLDKVVVSGAEIKKIVEGFGIQTSLLPESFINSLVEMASIRPPEGEGIINVFRNGKREYYETEHTDLYTAITLVNRKHFGDNPLMALGMQQKRFFTGMITKSPMFMTSNAWRDAISANILARDNFKPFIESMSGFGDALVEGEEIRAITAAGASFENGFITGGDTRATKAMIEKAIAKQSFQETLLNNPLKLIKALLLSMWNGYNHLGTSFENASRVAVYKAAKKSGKSKLRSAYEALDIMDYSMRGDSAVIQAMIALVPFLGARNSGMYRTGRGFRDNPKGVFMKGAIYMMASMALWARFRDDERYKQLEDWDRQTYHHFWIGDNHFRLPRAFEVGAIFTTIPELATDAIYQEQNDAEKRLFRQLVFMFSETFAINPIPQAIRPLFESGFNYNFFTGREIVNPMTNRLPPDQFSVTTSPTMRELAKLLPDELDAVSGKIRSPKHLENVWRGYTGTIGTYLMQMSDHVVRNMADYPMPPTSTPSRNIFTGRYFLGDSPPRRTLYETEFYKLSERVQAVTQSINMYQKTGIDRDRLKEILEQERPYLRVADMVKRTQREVRKLNEREAQIWNSDKMTRDEKRKRVDVITERRNKLFKRAYDKRPATRENEPQVDIDALLNDIDEGKEIMDQIREVSPAMADVLASIDDLDGRNLELLAKSGGGS